MQNVTLAIGGITLGAIYALVALGFNLIYRTVNVLDFAQGDKVVLGGLVALSLVNRNVPLALVFVIVTAGGSGGRVLYHNIVVRPSLRRGPDAAIVATVGALLVLSSGHILIYGATAQPFPQIIGGTVRIGKSHVDSQDFVVWVVVAMVVAAVALFLSRSRYGKAMVASAADPMAAGAVGIDVRQTRVIAAAGAFSLAALAGVLIAPITLAGGVVGPRADAQGIHRGDPRWAEQHLWRGGGRSAAGSVRDACRRSRSLCLPRPAHLRAPDTDLADPAVRTVRREGAAGMKSLRDRLLNDHQSTTWMSGGAVVVGALLFFLLAANDYQLTVGGTVGIDALAAMGLTVVAGRAGQLALGQAGFMAVGAYAAAYGTTHMGLSFIVAVIMGVAIASFLGLVVGYVALRLRGNYLAMATLGLRRDHLRPAAGPGHARRPRRDLWHPPARG